MEKEEIYEVYRKKGMRLEAEMSPLLYKWFYARMKGKGWKGLQMFDKAHTVMLMEENIIPNEVGIKILKALRQMEDEGVQKAREELGGHMHCGEAYVTKTLGPDIGGWIHCGRSSGDLMAVACRVDVRDAIIAIMKQLVEIRKTFLQKAEEHVDTVMPGYTHLQHAEPFTFGFYLLSFLHQLERDFERFQGAYRHTNISPAGCAILTTTDFPINRERTQELLGFDDIYTNAKDAIRTMDYHVEVLGASMGTAGVLGRLADDLDIWHSSEFKMVELPDAFCGTSSIMPQKKNPYGTECTRGLDGDVIGNVMSFLAVTKCQSDSSEMAVMAPIYVYRAAESCLAALHIMNGVVKDLKVNKELMEERAGMYWAQASILANTIVREKGIPFRSAHQIVSILVRLAYDEGKQPKDVTTEMVDRAAEEFNSKSLGLSKETLRRALDPRAIVESKKAIGGTAPERVREDIMHGFRRVEADEEIAAAMEARLTAAERRLEAAVDELLK